MITAFRRLPLNAKVMLALGGGLTLAIAAMIVGMLVVIDRQAERSGIEDLAARNRLLLAGVDALHKSLDQDVVSLMHAFKTRLGRLQVGPDGQLLAHDGSPMAGRVDEVDKLAENEGANATIFEKRGADFVRITSSVRKADGSRATGTKLAADGAAYAAVSGGRTYIGRAELFGKLYDTVYEPIVVDGKTVGVYYVGRNVAGVIAALGQQTNAIAIARSGYFAVVDAHGVAKIHPKAVGDKLTETGDRAFQQAYQQIVQRKNGTLRFHGDDGTAYTAVFNTMDGWKWTAVAIVPLAELLEGARAAERGLALAGLVLLVVQIAVLRALLGRFVTRPLASLADEVAKAEGGQLALALARHDDTRDEVQRLETALARTFSRLRDLVERVRASTAQVGVASEEIRLGTHDLSGRTESQAASLQQTASSMAQISEHARLSSERADHANRIAQAAGAAAEQGGAAIAKVVDTMQQIAASSQQVQSIVGVIDAIAFQTNILALNAAVEAARAGQAGRGFAVVASEVRALAQRSAEAAREIKGLIGASVANVGQGAQLVDDAGRSVSELVRTVRGVAATIDEISQASAQQLLGIEQVSSVVTDLDTVTQQNAALVEEASAATHSLAQQAQLLNESIAEFKSSTHGRVPGDGGRGGRDDLPGALSAGAGQRGAG